MRTLLAESRPPKSAEEKPLLPVRMRFLRPGWVSRSGLKAFTTGGIAEIAALANTERNFSAGPVLGLLDDLLEVEVDGIVMATPSALHAEQAVAACGRGLTILKTADEKSGRTSA